MKLRLTVNQYQILMSLKNSQTPYIGYLLLAIFWLACLSPSLAQNAKEDLSNLKKIKNDKDFIKSALELGELYAGNGQMNDAQTFFREAEKKGKSLGGSNAQATISLSVIDILLSCCYLSGQPNAMVFDRVKQLISSDKRNKLFYQRMWSDLQAINGKEKDPQKLADFYNLIEDYLKPGDLASLKTSNGLAQEKASLEASVEEGSLANALLKKSLAQTEGSLYRMSEVSDSMSGELTLKDAQLKNAAYRMMLDSLNTLRREELLAQQLEVIQIKQVANDRMRIALISLAVCFVLLAFFLFKIWRYSQIIKIEKARSEELLLNILPAEIAQELKDNGKVETNFFDNGTIMFLDFVGFSYIAKERSPKELVSDLNECFIALDELAMKHGIEKIKTIGDAYMCVSGIPVPGDDDVDRMVQFGFAILNFLKGWNKVRKTQGLLPFEARIGIHTGPLAAGVVGRHKFCFDVWGDTVNVASRLESGGKAGHICISEATRVLMDPKYTYDAVGMVNVKNMAPIEMFLLRKNV